MGEVIDGKAIAKKITEDVKREIDVLKKDGIYPKLVAVSVGENPASKVYINQQRKNCEKVGIEYSLEQLPEKDFLC